MAILEVEKFPSSVLQKKTKLVKKITPEIRNLVRDMFETMYHYNGIGLAANQVGKSLSVVVIDVRNKKDLPMVLINPTIKFISSKKSVLEEGCLSLPGYYEKVCRPQKIEVSFLDINGKENTLKVDGLLARVIQHEVDHLNGIVFIQRTSFVRALKFWTKFLLKKVRFN